MSARETVANEVRKAMEKTKSEIVIKIAKDFFSSLIFLTLTAYGQAITAAEVGDKIGLE